MHARTILRRRTVIGALACGTAGVIVAGSGLAATAASPAPSDTHSHRTLTLYQRQEGLLFVPGPPSRKPGTQVVGSFSLHSGAINGPIVGHAVTQCILEGTPDGSDSREALCHSMSVVPGGQISDSGLLLVGNLLHSTSPITGGTGTYRAATGQVISTPLPDPENRNSKIVFDLGN